MMSCRTRAPIFGADSITSSRGGQAGDFQVAMGGGFWVAAGAQLPDLDPVLDAYLDAYAIVHTASHAIHNGDGDDKAVATATLRQGVKAFDAANDRLEAANMQLSRYCRKGSKS